MESADGKMPFELFYDKVSVAIYHSTKNLSAANRERLGIFVDQEGGYKFRVRP